MTLTFVEEAKGSSLCKDVCPVLRSSGSFPWAHMSWPASFSGQGTFAVEIQGEFLLHQPTSGGSR